jgi:hypothetical protein
MTDKIRDGVIRYATISFVGREYDFDSLHFRPLQGVLTTAFSKNAITEEGSTQVFFGDPAFISYKGMKIREDDTLNLETLSEKIKDFFNRHELKVEVDGRLSARGHGYEISIKVPPKKFG